MLRSFSERLTRVIWKSQSLVVCISPVRSACHCLFCPCKNSAHFTHTSLTLLSLSCAFNMQCQRAQTLLQAKPLFWMCLLTDEQPGTITSRTTLMWGPLSALKGSVGIWEVDKPYNEEQHHKQKHVMKHAVLIKRVSLDLTFLSLSCP